MEHNAAIGTVDIETAPNMGYFWNLYKQNIPKGFVVDRVNILSWSFKWYGRDEVTYLDRRGGLSEKELLLPLWDLLTNADIVVGQNSDRFDVPIVRGRMLVNEIMPWGEGHYVDTCKQFKALFGFQDNSLATMGKLLNLPIRKLEHQKYPGVELWLETMKDNEGAWEEMRVYNQRDVEVTEMVYERIRPWIKNHPSVVIDQGMDLSHRCPKCGSSALQKRGTRTTKVGVYQRYYCLSCGSYPRGRKCLLTREQRASLLMPS